MVILVKQSVIRMELWTGALSQTIRPKWASRQFLTLPIVQTLVPVTFGYSLSSQEDFHRAFQKLLERYNKCIAAGGDYFEGDQSFICVLSIKVPIRKKCGNLFKDPRIYCRADKYVNSTNVYKERYNIDWVKKIVRLKIPGFYWANHT